MAEREMMIPVVTFTGICSDVLKTGVGVAPEWRMNAFIKPNDPKIAEIQLRLGMVMGLDKTPEFPKGWEQDMTFRECYKVMCVAPPPPPPREEGQAEDFNASMAANMRFRCTCCGNTYNLFAAGQPHRHECPPPTDRGFAAGLFPPASSATVSTAQTYSGRLVPDRSAPDEPTGEYDLGS